MLCRHYILCCYAIVYRVLCYAVLTIILHYIMHAILLHHITILRLRQGYVWLERLPHSLRDGCRRPLPHYIMPWLTYGHCHFVTTSTSSAVTPLVTGLPPPLGPFLLAFAAGGGSALFGLGGGSGNVLFTPPAPPAVLGRSSNGLAALPPAPFGSGGLAGWLAGCGSVLFCPCSGSAFFAPPALFMNAQHSRRSLPARSALSDETAGDDGGHLSVCRLATFSCCRH